MRPGAERPRAVEEATFLVLRDAVARLVPDAAAVDDVALGLWGLVHGMVSLELADLVPGDDAERAERYARATTTVGRALAGR